MSNDQIIRAWKDETYRSNLSEHERAQLPAHPAGLVELTDAQLHAVSGGLAFAFTAYCTNNTLCTQTKHLQCT